MRRLRSHLPTGPKGLFCYCCPTIDLKQSELLIFFNSYLLICSKLQSQNVFYLSSKSIKKGIWYAYKAYPLLIRRLLL